MAEVSELFPREGMNALFYDEIEKLHARQPMDPSELQRLMSMDFVGYIDRSLRNSGFRDPELDPMVHDIVVKLITGALFRNVQGPFLARFATAVKNSIITLATRRQRVRRRYSDHELETIPQRSAPQPEDDVVERFRTYVRQTLGEVALRVLDHRLDGLDNRDLRGQPGLESHYALKEMVKRIKRAATTFAGSDPDLLGRIEKALASEQQTLGRRFAGSRS
jgi:DNA-directed RNA polymerase specialized sigma24 family protein